MSLNQTRDLNNIFNSISSVFVHANWAPIYNLAVYITVGPYSWLKKCEMVVYKLLK